MPFSKYSQFVEGQNQATMPKTTCYMNSNKGKLIKYIKLHTLTCQMQPLT